MTEMTMEWVVTEIRAAMGELEAVGEVETAVRGEGAGVEVEVMGDEWTVHLEGWPERPVAFLAIEDEPEEGVEIRAARAEAMGDDAVAALAELDRRLDGTFRAALNATGDPLSVDLAEVLGRIALAG